NRGIKMFLVLPERLFDPVSNSLEGLFFLFALYGLLLIVFISFLVEIPYLSPEQPGKKDKPAYFAPCSVWRPDGKNSSNTSESDAVDSYRRMNVLPNCDGEPNNRHTRAGCR